MEVYVIKILFCNPPKFWTYKHSNLKLGKRVEVEI